MTRSVTAFPPPEPATGWGSGTVGEAGAGPTDPPPEATDVLVAAGTAVEPPAGPPSSRHRLDPQESQRAAPPAWPERTAGAISRILKRLGAYGLLAVMAGADAFFFYNTLAGIIQRGIEFLWVFVLALSVGAIVACEVAGRLVRRRRAARGGSLAWTALLVTIWLTLGIGLAWIRSQTSLGGLSDDETGALATAEVHLAWWQQPQVEVAALMLILYLLTGSLTMSFAYLFHDPTTPQERELMGLREAASRAALEAELRRSRDGLNGSGEPRAQPS